VPQTKFEKWRTSLKSGFIRIAKMSKSPVVPVYVENNHGHWTVNFGKPQIINKESDQLASAKEYLASMKALQNNTRKLLPPAKAK